MMSTGKLLLFKEGVIEGYLCTRANKTLKSMSTNRKPGWQ